MWWNRKTSSAVRKITHLQLLILVHIVKCALPPSMTTSDLTFQNKDSGDEGMPGRESQQQLHSHQASWKHNVLPERFESTGSSGGAGGGSSSRTHRWAMAAYNYIQSLDCQDVFLTTGRECRDLVAVPKSAMTLHVAAPSPYGKFVTVIPDEPLTAYGRHDGVVVVDPYPRASFGHLVVIFFVDTNLPRGVCQARGGVHLDNECMFLALRRRCRNAIERLSRRRNFARRCEINFLPVVHLDTDSFSSHPQPRHHAQHHDRNHRHQHQQQAGSGGDDGQVQRDAAVVSPVVNYLQCRSLLAGFGRCPDVVPVNETGPPCDHLRDNTRRCATTHDSVRTSCRMLEVCDQAVLLAGGWNRHTTGLHSLQNVQRLYAMLRRHGFRRRNIKVFFANGADPLQVGSEPPQKVYPASMKMAMRNHIRRLCLQPHCVDSLFLFLNSPARSDGSSLLWDVDGNGLAEEDERYTVRELKDDLADCGARQVVLVVDQSFSGELVQELRQSPEHGNLLIFASGRSNDYSYDDEYSRFWAAANHTHTCSMDVHSASRHAVRHSSPRMGEGEEGRVKATIFGAPCDVIPPFTAKELRQVYLGCQNLPTAVWLREILRLSETSLLASQEADSDDYNDNDDS